MPVWAEIERQRLVELAALQNHVYRDLAPASERLAPIVEASNGKHPTSTDPPGLTAAEQSRNELMAMWSGEMDRIAALRTVRALVRAERAAREQSEIAYAKGGHCAPSLRLAVWRTATSVRKADPQALLFLMESRGTYRVGKNGVAFKVGDRTLGYGAREPKLDRWKGRDVWITLDPADLSKCFAFEPASKRFIAELPTNQGISPLATVDDLREASADVNRRRKRYRQTQREAMRRRRSVAEELRANKRFVETSVAKEVLQVAHIVAETCGIGVVFGPTRIGKSMTLEALQGDQRFGDPVLITVNDATVHPFPLCRAICERFEVPARATYDRVFSQLVSRLKGTKRMLMFDEADLCAYRSLEMIRQLHDATGCPILLAGKPKVYERCGLREVGNFSEVTDQLAGRIVIRRDLTERTRVGKNPQPLFSLEDIRKLIAQAELRLKVAAEAEKWLQGRASSLGCGGLSYALTVLFYAFKMAYQKGDSVITERHVEAVAELAMGPEDAARLVEVVAESSGIRRVV